MERRAILVFGPESAGNHLMMQCLIAAGCDGDADDVQRWDSIEPDAPLIAWGKSVPTNGEWPDIVGMVRRLWRLGYAVDAVVMTRNWHATVRSQVQHGRVSHGRQALANLRRAYPHIFRGLAVTGIEYIVCHYDYLVTSPAVALGYVCGVLGLPTVTAISPPVLNANKKYEVMT